MEVGSIVRSMVGHDQGSFYVVVKAADGFVWIADGRRRSILRPKRKNPRHLAKTAQSVPLTAEWTDKKIRHSLWTLNFGTSQPVTEEEET